MPNQYQKDNVRRLNFHSTGDSGSYRVIIPLPLIINCGWKDGDDIHFSRDGNTIVMRKENEDRQTKQVGKKDEQQRKKLIEYLSRMQ